MAPQVGLEPTTLRLTAECSAIELLRNKRPHIACESLTMCRARSAFYNKCIFKRQPRANPPPALNLRYETICDNISSPIPLEKGR